MAEFIDMWSKYGCQKKAIESWKYPSEIKVCENKK